MTLEELQARGNRIALLAQDSDFRAAVEAVETRLTTRWRSAVTVDDREECHFTLRGLMMFVQEFKSEIDAGKLASAALEKKEK